MFCGCAICTSHAIACPCTRMTLHKGWHAQILVRPTTQHGLRKSSCHTGDCNTVDSRRVVTATRKVSACVPKGRLWAPWTYADDEMDLLLWGACGDAISAGQVMTITAGGKWWWVLAINARGWWWNCTRCFCRSGWTQTAGGEVLCELLEGWERASFSGSEISPWKDEKVLRHSSEGG